MAKAVVDLFEVVDVEQQERYRRLASACDRPIELLAQHQAVGKVGQAVVERVVLERRLCETLPAAKLRLLDGVLDRRSQPAEPVFQHIIHRTLTHGGHGQVVAHRARHDHKGDLQARFLHQLEATQGIELGLVIVGQDQVQLGVEVGLEAGFVIDPAPGRVEAGAAELPERELGVLGSVFQDQQAQRSSGHGTQIQRVAEQLVLPRPVL